MTKYLLLLIEKLKLKSQKVELSNKMYLDQCPGAFEVIYKKGKKEKRRQKNNRKNHFYLLTF